MKNKNNLLSGALVRIAVYVVAMSLYENLGQEPFGQPGRCVVAGTLLILLLLDLRRQKKSFCERPLSQLPYRTLLYLLPLAALATVNLWRGAVLRYSPLDTVFYVGAMLAVGAVEELIFRGYLLEALKEDSMRTAILISGLTFGLGHIVNLLNGHELVPTLLQLVYAAAIGVMLAVFMVRVKNIVPCCIFHGIFNALAAFANRAGQTRGYEVAVSAALTAVSAAYALYLWSRKELA